MNAGEWIIAAFGIVAFLIGLTVVLVRIAAVLWPIDEAADEDTSPLDRIKGRF